MLSKNADPTHPCTRCIGTSAAQRKREGKHPFFVDRANNCWNHCPAYKTWKKQK